MKILFTNFHEHYSGGHFTYIKTLAKALAAEHVIVLAAPVGSDIYQHFKKNDLTCFPIQFKYKFLRDTKKKRETIRKLRHLIFQQKIDIIHVNGSADHSMIMRAIRGLKNKPKMILTKHNSFPLKFSSRYRLLKGADCIIAVSEKSAMQLIEQGIPAKKIHVIPNGIDTDYFSPQDKKTTDTKCIILGSVAGTALYKGWPILMEALSRIENHPFKIVLAGMPISERHYNQFIVANKQQDHVALPGKIDDVHEIIPDFDIGFVLSNSVETISFATREMMSMGKPVIVSDYNGLPENIDVNKNGWVVATGNVDALEELLRDIIQMESKQISTMGKAARKTAVKKFGIQKFIQDTVKCYGCN